MSKEKHINLLIEFAKKILCAAYLRAGERAETPGGTPTPSLISPHTQARHRFDYALECLNTTRDQVSNGVQVFRFHDRYHVITTQ